VIGEGGVAVFAGVVSLAAFCFDGDDIQGGVVVEAAGLGVEVQAVDLGSGLGHEFDRTKRIAEGTDRGSKDPHLQPPRRGASALPLMRGDVL